MSSDRGYDHSSDCPVSVRPRGYDHSSECPKPRGYEFLREIYWNEYEQLKHVLERVKQLEVLKDEFRTRLQLKMPTVIWQQIASYLPIKDLIQLSQCDKHLYNEVVFGPYSETWIWKYHINTGLMERACELAKSKLVRLLLKAGESHTLLKLAWDNVYNNNIDMLHLMMEYNCNITEKDIYYTIRVKRDDILKILLDHVKTNLGQMRQFILYATRYDSYNFDILELLFKKYDELVIGNNKWTNP